MIFVRPATLRDVDAIVDLIELKRVQLEQWEPRFWRKAEGSGDMSKAFIPKLIEDQKVTVLVAEEDSELVGVLQFKPTVVPPVYAPGGTSWMVDDWVVQAERWDDVGAALLAELKAGTVEQEEGQLILPVPYKDDAAADFFQSNGLSATTVWWTLGANN